MTLLELNFLMYILRNFENIEKRCEGMSEYISKILRYIPIIKSFIKAIEKLEEEER